MKGCFFQRGAVAASGIKHGLHYIRDMVMKQPPRTSEHVDSGIMYRSISTQVAQQY